MIHPADKNGLELTPLTDSLNSYRLTAVVLASKKIAAWAAGTRRGKEWNMFTIGMYSDPRDAAYVAQEFEKTYTKEDVRLMIIDGTFVNIARMFREAIEIPKWKFPAEGMSIDEMLNNPYEKNYVLTAKDALAEVIKTFKLKVPSLKEVPALIKKVENEVANGKTLREAAKFVMCKTPVYAD